MVARENFWIIFITFPKSPLLNFPNHVASAKHGRPKCTTNLFFIVFIFLPFLFLCFENQALDCSFWCLPHPYQLRRRPCTPSWRHRPRSSRCRRFHRSRHLRRHRYCRSGRWSWWVIVLLVCFWCYLWLVMCSANDFRALRLFDLAEYVFVLYSTLHFSGFVVFWALKHVTKFWFLRVSEFVLWLVEFWMDLRFIQLMFHITGGSWIFNYNLVSLLLLFVTIDRDIDEVVISYIPKEHLWKICFARKILYATRENFTSILFWCRSHY